MHVVVVESPTKAKTVQHYLGGDYRVLASWGHVRDLPAKDGSVRPDSGFAMTYASGPRARRVLGRIRAALKDADSLICQSAFNIDPQSACKIDPPPEWHGGGCPGSQ